MLVDEDLHDAHGWYVQMEVLNVDLLIIDFAQRCSEGSAAKLVLVALDAETAAVNVWTRNLASLERLVEMNFRFPASNEVFLFKPRKQQKDLVNDNDLSLVGKEVSSNGFEEIPFVQGRTLIALLAADLCDSLQPC